eukprot:760482-Hanusia_phi.AAC.5
MVEEEEVVGISKVHAAVEGEGELAEDVGVKLEQRASAPGRADADLRSLQPRVSCHLDALEDPQAVEGHVRDLAGGQDGAGGVGEEQGPSFGRLLHLQDRLPVLRRRRAELETQRHFDKRVVEAQTQRLADVAELDRLLEHDASRRLQAALERDVEERGGEVARGQERARRVGEHQEGGREAEAGGRQNSLGAASVRLA